MSLLTLSRACLVALSCGLALGAAAAPSKIVAFGDSLSDNGNAAAAFTAHGATLQPSTDYLGGRYSNGAVAVEVMAERWNVGLQDLAVGGALTGTANRVGSWVADTGVQNQIAHYVSSQSGHVDSAALYMVWAGGNDFLAAPEAATVGRAVSNLVGDVTALYAAGARQFFIPNQFDLASTPLLLASTPLNQAAAHQVTLSFNAQLASAMASLQGSLAGASIQVFDTYATFASISAGLQAANGQVSTACFVTVACARPDRSLFWDGLHPSAVAHAALGQAFYAAAVPEPASALLLMLGLAGLALGPGRRRRAEFASPA